MEGKDPLDVSHAFINILSASYQGMYVFFNGMEALGGTGEWEEDRQRVAEALDSINGWWAEFKQKVPLVTEADQDAPSDTFRHAFGLLKVARDHQRWTLRELGRGAKIDLLMSEPFARHIRASASCEAAYAHEHYNHGLITYGEVMGREEVVDRWRQHIPHIQVEVNRAHAHLASVEGMGDEPVRADVIRLLDETLSLPALFGQRIVDICEVFALYTGHMNYQDAGVAAEAEASWQEAGFGPVEAGRWNVIGMKSDMALVWIRGGVPTPVPAFDFRMRGFQPEEAGAWIAQGIYASSASAWKAHGHTPEQAAARIAEGKGPVDSE